MVLRKCLTRLFKTQMPRHFTLVISNTFLTPASSDSSACSQSEFHPIHHLPLHHAPTCDSIPASSQPGCAKCSTGRNWDSITREALLEEPAMFGMDLKALVSWKQPESPPLLLWKSSGMPVHMGGQTGQCLLSLPCKHSLRAFRVRGPPFPLFLGLRVPSSKSLAPNRCPLTSARMDARPESTSHPDQTHSFLGVLKFEEVPSSSVL